MSAMWACYRCGEIGTGATPDVHSYKYCDVHQDGEDLARARIDAWNAAIEAAAEVVSQHFSQSNPETVALRIRALIRKVMP